MKNQAEKWWLNKGQYYDQDKKFYPKDVIIDAYMAGFDVGRVVGKSENEQANTADGEELCHCRENFSLTRLRCNICMKPIYPRRR